MTVYLVKYSSGSWEDAANHDHSLWDNKEIAQGVADKINGLIKNNGLEPEYEDTDQHIEEWSQWYKIGKLNNAWVVPILINNILPNQCFELKIN